MAGNVGAVLEGARPSLKCSHHWIIESPSGPTSRGRCKLCGEEKQFANFSADFFWEDESLPNILAGSSPVSVSLDIDLDS